MQLMYADVPVPSRKDRWESGEGAPPLHGPVVNNNDLISLIQQKWTIYNKSAANSWPLEWGK